MNKVIEYMSAGMYRFYCPGCKCSHWFTSSRWKWNGDYYKPTITPSLLINNGDCHLFVRNGMIEFLPDCKHELAGKTVEMEEV